MIHYSWLHYTIFLLAHRNIFVSEPFQETEKLVNFIIATSKAEQIKTLKVDEDLRSQNS
jgi:hypothetical protein